MHESSMCAECRYSYHFAAAARLRTYAKNLLKRASLAQADNPVAVGATCYSYWNRTTPARRASAEGAKTQIIGAQ
jgi:hypothetical protein